MTNKDNFVRCHEAIHVVCQAALPAVRKTLEDWHQRQVRNIAPCATPQLCPSSTKGKPTAKKRFCQNCIAWGQAIESTYYPQSSVNAMSWANIDPSLLSKDPVEVAKAFVLRLPQGHNYNDLEDFDVACILLMMLHCNLFLQGDQVIHDNVNKVSAIRNELAHMRVKDNFDLDAPTTAQYFDEISDLVKSLNPRHLPQQAVDDILKHLLQIKTSPITMIISNIQFGVSSSEIKQLVEEILEENRNTLDLDDTEETLDVHLCQRQIRDHYLQYLCKIPQYPGDTENYLDMDDIFTNLSILYDKVKPCGPISIPLSSDLRDLPPHHQIFTVSVNGMLPRRILILGRGGSGKSTLLAKIAYDWATKKDHSPLLDIPLLFVINMRCIKLGTNIEDAIVQQLLPGDTQITALQLLKYMKMHQTEFTLLFDSYDEFCKRDTSSINVPQGGSIVQALANDEFTSTRVLVTSRHWRASDFVSYQRIYAKFEVTGFSHENLNKYIMKTFGCYNSVQDYHEDTDAQTEGAFLGKGEDQEVTCQKGKRLCDYIAVNNLYSIASFPLMAQLFCLLWSESDETCLPSKIGDLYDAIFEMLYQQHVSKNASSSTITLKELTNCIGEVACVSLWPPANTLALPYKDIVKAVSTEIFEDACRIGIITVEKLSRVGVPCKDKYIMFFHKTGQEKCAGEFIARLASTDQDAFREHFEKLTTVGQCLRVQMILRFACGVCKVAAGLILQHLLMVAKSELRDDMVEFYEDTLVDTDKAKLVQEFIEMCLLCNYECNAAGEFNALLAELFPLQKLQFLGMTPYTSAAVGYFLANVNEPSVISAIKIIQLPQPGVIPSGNNGVLESVYKTAKTTFKCQSKEEIEELHRQYMEAHTNETKFNKFAETIKEDFTFGLVCIQQWEHFKTWNSSANIYLDPILDFLKSTSLRELDLTDVKLSDRGRKVVETITHGHLCSVIKLKLKDTGLATDHMCSMVKALHQNLPNLEILDVAGNDASERQIIHHLTVSLASLPLKSLNIRGMNAQAKDMNALANNLPNFAQGLNVLRIRGNQMNDDAGKTLADNLHQACRLDLLEISLVNMSKGVHKKLVTAIGHLTQIRDLRVYDSHHSDDLVFYMSKNSLHNLNRLTLGAEYCDEPKHPRLQKLLSATAIKKAEYTPIQTLNSSGWKKLLLTLERQSPQLKKLELYNISLKRKDMDMLMELCRRTGLELGCKRRCWPDGLDFPEDVKLDLY